MQTLGKNRHFTMTDKAVSTEDLKDYSLGLIKLEAFLNTLVENKVESLKEESKRSQSLQASPKNILSRLRLTSHPNIIGDRSSSVSKECGAVPRRISPGNRKKLLRYDSGGKESSVNSDSCQRCHSNSRNDTIITVEEQEAQDGIRIRNQCSIDTCSCQGHTSQMDDDFVSVKVEDTEAIFTEEALRRAHRKRRKRRKRRMKKRMMQLERANLQHVYSESYKAMNQDELSQQAKWTIVATACLLLFMCLLLVGITLRMAPLIDEMVRKENEEFVNSLQSESSVQNPS